MSGLELTALADELDEADAVYRRLLNSDMDISAISMAAGLAWSLKGHLFAKAAAALRVKAGAA